MSKLLKSEFYRILKSPKNRIIIMILLIYPFLFTGWIEFKSNSYMEELSEFHMNQSHIANIRALSLIRATSESEVIENRDQLITFFQDVSRHELSAGKFLDSDNRNNYHFINTSLNKVYNLYLNALENGLITDQVIRELGYTKLELKANAFYTDYLQKNVEEIWLNEFEVNGINSIKLFFNGQNLLILVILFFLLLSDIYIKDIHEGSYKQLFTHAIDRGKLLTAKLIVVLSLYLGISILIIFLAYFISSTLGGTGHFDYPLISNANNSSSENSFQIISIMNYLALSVVQFTAVSIALLFLSVFLSVKYNSFNIPMGIVFSLLFITFTINTILPDNSLLRDIYPFSYLYSDNVLNVNTSSSLVLCLALNGIIILGSLVASINCLSKKDLHGIA